MVQRKANDVGGPDSWSIGVPKAQEASGSSLKPLATPQPRLSLCLETTVEKSSFVAYVGPPQIHDGVIKTVRRRNGDLEVEIQAVEGAIVCATFHDVVEVQENRAQGMMVYALAELRHDGPGRLFSFTNWDDDDDAALAVVSQDVTFDYRYVGQA